MVGTQHPCPACQGVIVDEGGPPEVLLRCRFCGHERARAALVAADPAFAESLDSAPTLAGPSVSSTTVAPPRPASFGPGFAQAYDIVTQLGAGAMGVVFLARERATGRLVAIKTLKLLRGGGSGTPASGPQGVARFQREAASLAQLDHPNILSIRSSGEHDGVPWLVFEYVEGRNLKRVLAEERPLAIERAIEFALALLSGLEHAHGRGVLHRDLKPDNILIPASGGLKIADFGLARIVDAPKGGTLTATGMILGTPNYMSPEQARGARAIFASDIYAVGVILYEMIVGTVPFTAPTVAELYVQHMKAPVPDLAAKRPEAPAALCAAAARALAKDAKDRWPSASAFREALVRSTR